MTAGTARLAEPGPGKDTAVDHGARGTGGLATVILLPTARRPAGAVRAPERAPGGQPVADAPGHGPGGRPVVRSRPVTPAAGPVPPARGGAPARSGTPAAGPVVLTRRGRVVVTGFLALVAAGLLLVLPRAADATGAGVSQGRHGQNLSQVAVRPGDTLWSVAVRADPGADPRAVVQQVTDLNALAGTGIAPGQVLWVPKN
jgi:LysM domain